MYIHTPTKGAHAGIPQLMLQGKNVSKAIINFLSKKQFTKVLIRDSEYELLSNAKELVIN